ncbi:MAG: DUF1559 domain-containing protein [Candidatus Omnitrophica bacterium]|nr:DUF1559 domain-containing protein [Candidatus Omnitrophota bacterium]
MLLPALAAAREKARQSVCLNNLHQIGLACLMYAQDYHTFYGAGAFPYYGAYGTWSPVANLNLLYGPYIKSSATFVCPDAVIKGLDHVATGTSLTSLGPGETWQEIGGWPDYGEYHVSYAYYGIQYGSALTDAANPDSVLAADQSAKYIYGKNSPWFFYFVDNNGYFNTSAVPNHSGGANALYVSGNVKWVPNGDLRKDIQETDVSGYHTLSNP